MDPNAALAKVREALTTIQPVMDNEHWDDDIRYSLGDDLKEAVESLVEHVQALDEWLSRGGFQPEAWQQKDDVTEDDLDFARETLGADATEDEVRNLADLRADRDRGE